MDWLDQPIFYLRSWGGGGGVLDLWEVEATASKTLRILTSPGLILWIRNIFLFEKEYEGSILSLRETFRSIRIKFNASIYPNFSMTVLRGSEVQCSLAVDLERAEKFMDILRQRSISIESGIQVPNSPYSPRNHSGESDSGDVSMSPPYQFVSLKMS